LFFSSDFDNMEKVKILVVACTGGVAGLWCVSKGFRPAQLILFFCS